MSSAPEAEAPKQEESAEAPKKGGLPVKTIGIVAGMLVVEAVLIVAASIVCAGSVSARVTLRKSS